MYIHVYGLKITTFMGKGIMFLNFIAVGKVVYGCECSIYLEYEC
jgi:hypothetical protein